MKTVTPYGGWLLDRAVEIDEHCPGFAGHLHRCSSERRHAIAAYLSSAVPATELGSLAETGRFLASASHDDILGAAFGTVPQGYRGALARGGQQPYRQRYYRYLYAMMSSNLRPSMTRLIHHLPRVNPTRLQVARILPADLRRANLVMVIRDPRIARDVADLLRLLEGAGADRAAMVAALRGVETLAGVSDWARRWAFRARLPKHPAPESNGYMPVQSGEELKRVAIRHRNCTRNYLANALEGRSAFAVVVWEKSEAVVHLIKERGAWTLDDIYGPGNSAPDPKLVTRATDHLAQHGIGPRGQRPRSEYRWAPLRRIAGHLDFENGFELD